MSLKIGTPVVIPHSVKEFRFGETDEILYWQNEQTHLSIIEVDDDGSLLLSDGHYTMWLDASEIEESKS